jgi:hypothetical protein
MRYSLLILFLLLPVMAFAKRAAPTPVEPVVADGVRYVAPLHYGWHATVEAWDIQSNQKLWELTVFNNVIVPFPLEEEDAQWVFIKSLKLEGDRLLVTSETGKTYTVNLKTRTVDRTAFYLQILLWAVCEPIALVVVIRLWIKRPHRNIPTRIIWSLILLIPLFGLIAYFFLNENPSTHPYDTDTTSGSAVAVDDGSTAHH